MGQIKKKLFFLKLISEDSGQGTVEYLLLLAASVVAAAGLLRSIYTGLDLGIATLGGQLEKDLKTGRASLSVWTN